DQKITFLLYLESIDPTLTNTIYFIASGFVYVIPIVLLVMFWRSHRDRIVSMKIFLAALLAWQGLTTVVGDYLYTHYLFRDRPFTGRGIQELFFEQPHKAFPSDHAAVLMVVIVAAFAYRYPKLGYVFLIGGVLSSLARVVIGFHWFGDILAGWLLGAIAVGVIWLFDRPITVAFEWVIKKFSRSYGRR
ncbi:MAG: phosphatase PAP2 family protein, partial [Patescibacteria group bacterium]